MTDPALPAEPGQEPGSGPGAAAPANEPGAPGPAPTPAPAATPSPVSADPDRRRFFRLFAGDVMSSVGSVLGAAQALQQQSAEAARELLGGGPTDTDVAADGRPAPVEQPAAGAGFRAPFRWDGDVCWLVDQRRLPDTLVDLEVRTAAEAVTAIRDEAIVGAPAQAQLVAIAIAHVAGQSVASRPFARRASIRGAANALRNSRPASAAVTSTTDRMLAVLDAFDVEAPGDEIATALRIEAEAVIREAVDAHGALVAHALEVLPGEAGGALRVLTIGSTGPMGGGQLGTAASVIAAAHHATRPIHALVAETRPGFIGSRICAWELREAGVSHAVVPDPAAPACIAAGEVDAVIVGADRVAANGDVVAVAGTYPLALAAAAAGIPLIVCTATSGVDISLVSGRAAFPEQGRPSSVLLAGGVRVAPQGTQVRAPLQDITPAELVTAIVTEQGVIRTPFEPGLATHVEAAAARRAASPNPALPAPAADDAATGEPEPGHPSAEPAVATEPSVATEPAAATASADTGASSGARTSTEAGSADSAGTVS